MKKERSEAIINMTPDEYDNWLRNFNNKDGVVEVTESNKVWKFDEETYKLIGEYELQEDPCSPGTFLRPDNVTDVHPLSFNTLKDIYWDPGKKEWYYKDKIHEQVWYSKTTGEKGLDVNEGNVHEYINIKPKIEGLMKFDSDKKVWVWNIDEVRQAYLRELNEHKFELLKTPIETSYGTFNKIDSIIGILREFMLDMQAGLIKKAKLRLYSNEMIEVDFKQLKEISSEIASRKEDILHRYWEAKDHIQDLSEDELKTFFDMQGMVKSSPIGKPEGLYDKYVIIRSMLSRYENNF